MIGRSLLGAALVAALICIPFLPDRGKIWVRAWGAMRDMGGLLVALIFVAWMPSLGVSVEPLVSFTTMMRSLLYIVAAVFIWSTLVRDSQTFNDSFRTLAVSAAVLASISVIGLLGSSEVTGFVRGDGWARIPAGVILKESAIAGALLAPVLIWTAIRLRGIWANFCVIAVIEFLVMMWATANRSAMAGMFAVLIVIGLTYALHKRSFKITALSLFTVVLGGCVIIGLLYIRFENMCADFSPVYYSNFHPNCAIVPDGLPFPIWLIDLQRQEIWAFSWQAGETNRWFGVGINVIDKLRSAA